MTEKQKTWGKYALATVLVLVLGYLGYNYPTPSAPAPSDVLQPESVSVTQFRSVNVQHNLDVDGTTDTDDLTVDGGLVDIGGGSYATADGDNDLGVAADLEVDGATDLDGTLAVAGAATFAGGVVGTENVENMFVPTMISVPITWTAVTGGSGVVATVGAGEVWIVHRVLVSVTTDFDVTGDDATLVIGDGDDPNGFCDLADAELQIADTEGTGWSAGWQCQVAATVGPYIDENGGFVYDGAETIDWLLDETSGDTYTAGAATIYVWYTRIQ
jgi:hypothetical protein